MNLSMPLSTWIWLTGIVASCFLCWSLVRRFKNDDKLISNRRIVDYFPTAISSLGVLGTFWGITQGLIAFNPGDLDKSIPELLDGLKTAFFTSIAGMIGSMILSAFINRKQDKRDDGVSDIHQAAGIICKAVQQIGDLNKSAIAGLSKQMEETEKDRKAFYRSMGDVMNLVRQSQSAISETLCAMDKTQQAIVSAVDSIVILQRSQEAASSAIREIASGMITSIGNLEEATAEQTKVICSIKQSSDNSLGYARHIPEILDVLSGMNGTQDEMNVQIQKLKDILDAEVMSIEESMGNTNSLLERKFDEFTLLLKKSNTEALVEVMRNVTEEFQKQMNTLINKLIQENFDQLNKSVERLNQWQQENKDMITSLTKQYNNMAASFESTSSSLARVKDDTSQLVSEGGKLHLLINALNEVIINDEKFLDISNKLQHTADLSHSNMEAFDASTRKLNDWVRKQRNFVDGVQLLIEKLDEICKIKDYSEQFWKGTKQSLEEGLGIIKSGSQALNAKLTDLDRSFYARLGTTLSELDACIQAMVKGK